MTGALICIVRSFRPSNNYCIEHELQSERKKEKKKERKKEICLVWCMLSVCGRTLILKLKSAGNTPNIEAMS